MHRGWELAFTIPRVLRSGRMPQQKRFQMPSPFRCAAIIIATVAVCGSARSQELAPPGSAVSINKITIHGPFSQTVKYYVTGGSSRLQALVRRSEERRVGKV